MQPTQPDTIPFSRAPCRATPWFRRAGFWPAAAAAPDFRGMHLVPNAGHWVQFEQPEAFDAALLAALA